MPPRTTSATDASAGLAFGVAAYSMWGLFPLYWPMLEPAGSVEVLAHRIVWTPLGMGLLLLPVVRRRRVRQVLADRRASWWLLVAACVISVNWGTYIYGVTHDKVVETSLGYFINPLVTVLMGVAVLGERLRRIQWAALTLALVAVLVLGFGYGRPPWVALTLAFSFGCYALAKKQASVGAVESLTIETLVLAPIGLGYLLVLQSTGEATFVREGAWHTLLLIGAGPITAIPLLCFGAAAIRVSMTTVGLLQYLAPTIQFALGVLVFHEAMTPARWVGFVIVWIALILFTAETVHHQRQLRLVAESSAA